MPRKRQRGARTNIPVPAKIVTETQINATESKTTLSPLVEQPTTTEKPAVKDLIKPSFWDRNLFLAIAGIAGAIITGFITLYAAGKLPYQSPTEPVEAKKTDGEFAKNRITADSNTQIHQGRDDVWYVIVLYNNTRDGIAYETFGSDRNWTIAQLGAGEKRVIIERDHDVLFSFEDSTGNIYLLRSTKFFGDPPSEEQALKVKPNEFVLNYVIDGSNFLSLRYDGLENLPISVERK